ncbi:Protein Skeletor, isoforms D/E [Orchesella cincta]|uniref:Protein Skeletor, isoforms D/E n=1 Tax=Orchesella cincta TaxID=48709 RepID=A0A1D2MQ02_ORCCI|nr:Protein Skeletor, isoforms D/E [Orchesella cincta]
MKLLRMLQQPKRKAIKDSLLQSVFKRSDKMLRKSLQAVTILVAVMTTCLYTVDADYPSTDDLTKYCNENSNDEYNYKEFEVGWLKEGTKEHSIKGKVFILDKYRFKIYNFTYDGEAPSTYVLAMKKGTTGFYPAGGYTLYISGIDENGKVKYTCINLADPAYRFGNLSLTVSLPAGVDETVTTRDIRAISIFSYEFCTNFRSREFPELPESGWNAVLGHFTPYCPVKSGGKVNNSQLVADIKEVCDENERGGGGFPLDICSGVASLANLCYNLVLILSVHFMCKIVYALYYELCVMYI